EQAYKRAVEAGAREAVIVDTLGIATPEAVAQLVGRARDWLGADVPIHFHGHNDFGLATAAAGAAVRAGAAWIHGTINGMGERVGLDPDQVRGARSGRAGSALRRAARRGQAARHGAARPRRRRRAPRARAPPAIAAQR